MSHSESPWEVLSLSPNAWLAAQLISYYGAYVSEAELTRTLYRWSPIQPINWAYRWMDGERDTIYDELPESILKYISEIPL